MGPIKIAIYPKPVETALHGSALLSVTKPPRPWITMTQASLIAALGVSRVGSESGGKKESKEGLLKGKHKESAVWKLSIGDRTEISSTPSELFESHLSHIVAVS